MLLLKKLLLYATVNRSYLLKKKTLYAITKLLFEKINAPRIIKVTLKNNTFCNVTVTFQSNFPHLWLKYVQPMYIMIL
jgi:hypothetical protein